MEKAGALFDPASYVVEIEAAARAGGWKLDYLNPAAASARPWLHRPGTHPDSPRFYLSSGMHGDEIAGPLAVLELLRDPESFRKLDTVVFPILNPDGLLRGERGNAAGLDLNRDYREPKSSEVAGHLTVLKTLDRFDGAMCLHEDFEGTGAYLYALNETLPAAVGPALVAAMARHVPIDLRPEIEEVKASGGLLDRHDLLEKFGPIEERPEWPEALYLGQHHTRASFTTETPMLQPLDRRIAAQVAAVRALLEVLVASAPGG